MLPRDRRPHDELTDPRLGDQLVPVDECLSAQ
jgi:hypothetical protein